MAGDRGSEWGAEFYLADERVVGRLGGGVARRLAGWALRQGRLVEGTLRQGRLVEEVLLAVSVAYSSGGVQGEAMVVQVQA